MRKGFAQILILGLIAVVLVLGGAFYWKQILKSQSTSPSNIPKSSTKPSTPILESTQSERSTNEFKGKEIYIFTDEDTFNALSQKINRLASDIMSDLGTDVIIKHSTYSSSLEIRDILKQSYKQNNLAGSVLIGSIPTFLYSNNGYDTYTDWFYQDLDDGCTISSDGTFTSCEDLNSILKRDVFTGRITPPINTTNGLSLIEKYLDKNHEYRLGKISFPKKLLLYPSTALIDINNGVWIGKNSLEKTSAQRLNHKLDIYNRTWMQLRRETT